MTVQALDLFAGGGGVAVAMRALGIEADHVELDPLACATLRAAGERDVHCLDVRKFLGVAPPRYRPDLLWSSHPCPKWSTATSRTREKAVDGWPWTLDIIDALRPPVVCVENVKNAPAAAWALDLQRRGYKTWHGVLNAQWYGVPQSRRRVIVIATLGGKQPRVPAETVSEPLPMRGALDPIGDRAAYPRGFGRAASEPWRLDQPSPTVMTTEVKGTRASAASGGTFHGGPDRVSDAVFIALGMRRINEQEAARLQGFPEGYPFQGTSAARYRQIGNAVPPPLALAVLREGLRVMP